MPLETPGAASASDAVGTRAETRGAARLAQPPQVGPQQVPQAPMGMLECEGDWWWLAHSRA